MSSKCGARLLAHNAIDHNNNQPQTFSITTNPHSNLNLNSKSAHQQVDRKQHQPEIIAKQTNDDNISSMTTPSSGIRLVKLRQNETNSKLGFSLRGGKEATGSSVGVFVSNVERHSEADRKGLKIGDQLVQVNGLNVDQATYEEVIHLIKQTPQCSDICLKVNNLGKIPFQERQGDPIKWLQVTDLVQLTSNNNNGRAGSNRTAKETGKEFPMELQANGSGSLSSDEGLDESYNGSHRLANSLSSVCGAGELSDGPQQSPTCSSSSSDRRHNAATSGHQNRRKSHHHHAQHDSAVSSTITSSSLDDDSTCSSSSAACSISISSLQSSSAASAAGSGSCSDDDAAQAAKSREPLREILVKVPGGRSTSEPFGCGVVKGPEEWPGIFVQSVRPASLAERVGLESGDQLTRADGQPLDQLSFDAAIQLIKRLQQQQNELKLHVKKGAALRYLAERGSQSRVDPPSSGTPLSQKPEAAAAAARSAAVEQPKMVSKTPEVASRSAERIQPTIVVNKQCSPAKNCASEIPREAEAANRKQQVAEKKRKFEAPKPPVQPPQAEKAKKLEKPARLEAKLEENSNDDELGAADEDENETQDVEEKLIDHFNRLGDEQEDDFNEVNDDDLASSESANELEQEQIRIVSQNCKLHYSHQSMATYKQQLALEKFKQQQPKMAHQEPPKTRPRRQVLVKAAVDDALRRRQPPEVQVRPVRTPVAACQRPLQRHMSMECLSATHQPLVPQNYHYPQQQQQQHFRRLRSSSASRQEQVQLAAIRAPQAAKVMEPSARHRMYRCASSLLLNGAGHQPRLGCCDKQEQQLRCLALSAAAADCATRTLASRALVRCCNRQALDCGPNPTQRFTSRTLEPPNALAQSRNRARSMDKLNQLSINLNYVKIATTTTCSSHYSSSRSSGGGGAARSQQQRRLQQQPQIALMAPCADELCCLQQQQQQQFAIQQQQRLRVPPEDYCYATSHSGRSPRLRQQVAPNYSLDDSGRYCPLNRKQQLRRALAASQNLIRVQQQQQQPHCCQPQPYPASTACPVIPSGCCTPTTTAPAAATACFPQRLLRQQDYAMLPTTRDIRPESGVYPQSERRMLARPAHQLRTCNQNPKLCSASARQQAPVPPPLPPLVPSEKLYSPRDTRQRLTTFGSSSACSSTSSSGPMSSPESGPREDPNFPQRRRMQCRRQTSPAPVPPPPREQAAPCPPPPPAPDAEFDCKVGRLLASAATGSDEQRQSRARSQRAPEVAERSEQTGSGSNRLCFVDELKMLAKQTSEQQTTSGGSSSGSVATSVEHSATLIKIINASKLLAHQQRAANKLAVGCSCNQQQQQQCKHKQPLCCSASCATGGKRCPSKSCVSHRCPKTSVATQEPASKNVKLQDEDSKRRQHEMLMKEFKSAHSKMFSKRKNPLEEQELDEIKETLDLDKRKGPPPPPPPPQQTGDMKLMTDKQVSECRGAISEPAKDCRAAPEVSSSQSKRNGHIIKTINTKKISLLAVQTNPVHVAAAN